MNPHMLHHIFYSLSIAFILLSHPTVNTYKNHHNNTSLCLSFIYLKGSLKEKLGELTVESVVKVTGTVRRRPEGQENTVSVLVCCWFV